MLSFFPDEWKLAGMSGGPVLLKRLVARLFLFPSLDDTHDLYLTEVCYGEQAVRWQPAIFDHGTTTE